MGKDPAILFYTADFLTGTMLMTDAQKGRYITLLCLQHQKGRLSEKDIITICGGKRDDEIFAKFENDRSGYYNARMDEVISRRRLYTESRRKNLKGRANSAHKDSHMDSHMENENRNENRNENETVEGDIKGVKKELVSQLEGNDDPYELTTFLFWQLFVSNRESYGVTPTTLMKAKVNLWVPAVRRMVEIDNRTEDEIREVFRFLQRDPFWGKTILSTVKLREHFERLLVDARDKDRKSNKGCRNEVSSYQDTYYKAITLIKQDEPDS